MSDVGDRTLIEGMHRNACPDEGRDDLGLQVREVRFESENFGDFGGDKC